MNKKILKLCRYLAAIALVLDIVATLSYGIRPLSFTALLYSYAPCIFRLIIAVALVASNRTLVIIGCGINGFVSVLEMLYPVFNGESFFCLETILYLSTAACYILIAVSLFQNKSPGKIIPIAIIVGVVGTGLHDFLSFSKSFNAFTISMLSYDICNCIQTYVFLLIGILALGEKMCQLQTTNLYLLLTRIRSKPLQS